MRFLLLSLTMRKTNEALTQKITILKGCITANMSHVWAAKANCGYEAMNCGYKAKDIGVMSETVTHNSNNRG